LIHEAFYRTACSDTVQLNALHCCLQNGWCCGCGRAARRYRPSTPFSTFGSSSRFASHLTVRTEDAGLACSNGAMQGVRWTDDTVDNEDMGKKKSKSEVIQL
jgi:Protein phosphatase inhibitor